MSGKRKAKFSRVGPAADSWLIAVGPALEVIPATQLPTKRTVLRRYRSLRMCNENAPTYQLTKVLLDEVCSVWHRARVPICPAKNAEQDIRLVIDWWAKQMKFSLEKKMERCVQDNLNSLLDISVKPRGRGRVSDESH